MNILLFIIVFLWCAVISKNILFWAYLWQVKEYRYDRMRVHFELRSARALFFNKRTVWLGALFITSLIPVAQIQIAARSLVLLFYAFFAIRAGQQLQKRTLKTPRLTFRMLLILAFSGIFYLVVLLAVLLFAPSLLITSLVVGDILTPGVVTLGILSTHKLFAFLKEHIIQRATRKREQFQDLLVIGITGSYGKSTMKELIATILSRRFSVLKTPANINSAIGVANIILKNLTKEHEVFIVEMGAYHKGEIAQIAECIKPQIGVLTGINAQHVSLFGSIQNIQEGKYELIEALPEKGLAIMNGDNEYVRELFRQCIKPKRLYASDPRLDITYQTILVQNVKTTSSGLEITVREKENDIEEIIKTKLLGMHNVTNIIGAITVARQLNVEFFDIKAALLNFQPPPHTLRLRRGIKDSVIIDDSYSANLDGVLAALDVLKRMSGKQKLCILQPLIELGPLAESAHKTIATRIAEICDYAIITSHDYFALMCKEALENGMAKEAFLCIPSARQALRKAQELTDKDDVVLIENRVPYIILQGLILHHKEEQA